MKLTRLRLIGFKSFVEPTDFLIEPGLTGVVGPNGCGKSNLVEALRWVMGENSYKSMRADRHGRRDFLRLRQPAGAQQRRGRRSRIDNSERAAPAAVQRCTTCSKWRAASSATPARPIASTAARCAPATCRSCSPTPRPARVRRRWCIRAGSARSSRPSREQRRRVLEEAAGISGLHARRHEAELRLRAAEQNLAAAGRRDRPARRADRRAQAPGAPGGALPQRVRRRCARPRRRCSTCAGSTPTPKSPRPSRPSDRRRPRGRRTHRSRRPKPRSCRQPARPRCRRCARPRRKAGAALQRLVVARETLDREEARAKERIAELDRRLVQLADDIDARAAQLAADARGGAGAARRRGSGAATRGAGSGDTPQRRRARVTAAEAVLGRSREDVSAN